MARVWFRIKRTGIAGAMIGFALPAGAQVDLPKTEGKEVIERTCTVCHGADLFTRRKRDRDAWQRTVDDMEGRGAKASPDEFAKIVQYLVTNFGISEEEKRLAEKVNVNKAAAWRISRALRLFPEDGEAIVAYREKNGDFKSLQDLAKVPGIDPKKIEEARDRILF
jgi:competence protein ComEA